MKIIRAFAVVVAASQMAVGAQALELPTLLEFKEALAEGLRTAEIAVPAAKPVAQGPVLLTISREDRSTGMLLVYHPRTIIDQVCYQFALIGTRHETKVFNGERFYIAGEYPVAGGRFFTQAELDSLPDVISALKVSPKTERRAWDPKGAHEKVFFPMMQKVEDDDVALIPYAFGGYIVDGAFTAVGQTAVSLNNAGAQAVTFVKNTVEKIEAAIHNAPIKRASRKSKDILSYEKVGYSSFSKIVFALNSFGK